MNTDNFNHDAKSLPEALGFTDDQYDEVMFKVMQILKRLEDGKQSERVAACMKWAYEKFDSDEMRSAAIFMMGQAVEKANMMTSMANMMSSSRDGILDLIRQRAESADAEKEKMAFQSESTMNEFMTEFKALVTEFNGEDVGGDLDGMMAIKLEPGRSEEFHKRFSELKKKYSVEGVEEMSSFPTMFGGPIGQA